MLTFFFYSQAKNKKYFGRVDNEKKEDDDDDDIDSHLHYFTYSFFQKRKALVLLPFFWHGLALSLPLSPSHCPPSHVYTQKTKYIFMA